MARKMISYRYKDGIKTVVGSIMISRIVRFSKKVNFGITNMDVTIIHLDNGETIETEDSINSLESIINNEA